jgi:hypothetical protein
MQDAIVALDPVDAVIEPLHERRLVFHAGTLNQAESVVKSCAVSAAS